MVVASNTGDTDDCDVEGLARSAQEALDAMGRGEWELSLLVCDDAFIAPLNQQWRGKDGATDVLSFPQLTFDAPEEPTDLPPEPVLIGDVVVSLETAARQAAERGHDTAEELVLLTVHGICHLLGHTHAGDADRRAMRAREHQVLSALGLHSPSLIARSDGDG